MFNSTTLDVVIGLFFVYLVLSLMCTAFKEAISTFAKGRAKDLERGLRECLEGAPTVGVPPNGLGLLAKFYNHPLIFGLFPGEYKPGGGNLPSYIPAKTFALALMDVILPPQALEPPAANAPNAPAPVAGQAVPPLNPAPLHSDLASFRQAVENLPDGQLRGAMLALIDKTGGNVDRVREGIEGWYNSAMDRISGIYKRHTQIILLGIALGIAVLTNADTIALFQNLSVNEGARKALLDAVVKAREQAHGDAEQLTPDEKDLEEKIFHAGLPIGWDVKDPRSFPQVAGKAYASYEEKDWWQVAPQWVLKVIGWALTTLAISLGAPFWFDLLDKFMVVRSTVKPEEKSKPEPAKPSPGPNVGG